MSGETGLKIRVLFFGATADVAGTRAMQLELPADASTGDALESLIDRYPALASHKLLYSINQTYAKGDERLKDEDELAVFTAVSGG